MVAPHHQCLNPLYLGAIFRGRETAGDVAAVDVLIPYISGLSFGVSKSLSVLVALRLNPLYLGAIFRGGVANQQIHAVGVLIPYISGLSFGAIAPSVKRTRKKVLIPYISGLSFGGLILR